MPRTINIFLAGMQHHVYLDEVANGFADYMGCTVSLRKEDDNRWDKGKAVAAYLNYELLAYVTGGDKDKKRMRKLMEKVGKSQIRGTIRKFIKAQSKNESDMLQISVKVPDEVTLQEDQPDEEDWSQWLWLGPVLPLSEEAHQLHAVTDELLEMLRDGEPLDDYMLKGLEKMAELSWADISKEMFRAYSEILSLLTMGANLYPEMEEAAVKVQQIMTHIGSPEVREKVYAQMMKTAKTSEVARIIASQQYDLVNLTPQISQVLVNMMSTDAQGMIGRIWYMGMPQVVLNGVMSSLTFLLRLLIDNGQHVTDVHVPIDERVIEVGKLLASCEGMPMEFCKNVCNIIATNVPMLDQSDLDRLKLASKGTPQIGIQITNSVVQGNNMADSIQSAADGQMPVPPMTALPIAEAQKLLTDKKDGIQ